MKRTPTPLLAAEGGEVDDLVVVDATHHDAVDLHRVEAGVERGVDAGDHPVEVVAAGELAEHLGAQGVEGHVDPAQAGVGEVVRHLRELHAVGGHGDVDPEGGEHRDQPRQVRADSGLPARDADRLEAEALDPHPHDPGLLLVGEQLVAVQPGHALLGHAVGAAEVAAVGDRHAQVGDPAPERIDQWPSFRPGCERLHPPRLCDLRHIPSWVG